MTGLDWLRPIYSFLLESTFETILIFLLVWAILRLRGGDRPLFASQMLFLPLIIPVLISPGLHLLFPHLTDLALVTRVERAVPWMEYAREGSAALTPLLAVAFGLVLGANLARWIAIWLREQREHARNPAADATRIRQAWPRILRGLHLDPSQVLISRHHPYAAYVFGWARPFVTVGQAWVARLDASEFEALVAHELAHFQCGDSWLVLVAKACRDLMFFNPLAHHIYGRFVAAREEAADDAAVLATGKPFALASCLLKFWRERQTSFQPGGLALARPEGLERRIHRIVTGDCSARTAESAPLLVYAISLALATIFSVI